MSYQQDVLKFISSIAGQKNIIAIPVEFVRFTGDYNSAALLTKLLYWQGKQRDPEEWIFKTYEQWSVEIALSKDQTTKAAETLKALGILQTKVARVRLGNGMLGDRAVHYVLNQENFTDSFGRHLQTMESEKTSLSKVEELHFPRSSSFTNLSSITESNLYELRTAGNFSSEQTPPEILPDKEPSVRPSVKNNDDLKKLIQALPENHRTTIIIARLKKALKKQGHSPAYLLEAIGYTVNHAPENFKKHLGHCIDGNLHAGYFADQEQMQKLDKEKQQKSRQELIIQRQRQEQEQQKFLQEQQTIQRRGAIVDNIKNDDPDRYRKLHLQACSNIGVDPQQQGRGIIDLKIKFEIFRLLDL